MITETVESPVVTLKEVETMIQDWQDKLNQARAALALTEQGIGEIALDQGVDTAIHTITHLQVEVKMAETALAAVQSQREAVKRREQQERARQLRAQAAELEAQVKEHEAFHAEWSPKVEFAYQAVVNKGNKALMLQRQADEIEYKYGQVTP